MQTSITMQTPITAKALPCWWFRAGGRGLAALTLIMCSIALADGHEDSESGKTGACIPWAEPGANASAQYQGNSLYVLPAQRGARLSCVFQKLEVR